MGSTIEMVAKDGHRLSAYHAAPKGVRRDGLVLIQEIFGVNEHIRDLAERFADEGYEVIAPALFDRLSRGVELGYDAPGVAEGRRLRTELGWDAPISDIDAARGALASRGKVGAVGYCWGGSLSWLAACRTSVTCAVAYYGAQIAQHKDETPRCPVMMHFGSEDPLISAEQVQAIREAHPEVTIHLYAAGHGFSCDRRGDYDEAAAGLARDRTLAFFREHLA